MILPVGLSEQLQAVWKLQDTRGVENDCIALRFGFGHAIRSRLLEFHLICGIWMHSMYRHTRGGKMEYGYLGREHVPADIV